MRVLTDRWFRAQSGLAIVMALWAGALVQAAPVQPADPTFSWLFDGTSTPQFGPFSGVRAGAGGANPTGPAFVSVAPPMAYAGNQFFRFDGADDTFTIADAPSLRPGTGSWSTAVWFRTSTSQFGQFLGKRENGGGFDQWSQIVGTITGGGTATPSGNVSLILRGAGGASNYWSASNSPYADGNWHQMTVVRSGAGGDPQIYIDGALAAFTEVNDTSAPPENIANLVPWILGSNNGGVFYTGDLDDFAMWNTALTAQNAEWLFANSLLNLQVQALVPEPGSLALGLASLVIGCGMLWRRRWART